MMKNARKMINADVVVAVLLAVLIIFELKVENKKK